MKTNDNLIDNNEIDFYFLLAHATRLNEEELMISCINYEEFGIQIVEYDQIL